ncbi:MAG: FAD-dependent oxidoreductase [Proteobacteria bacterium]|nr:FAD-dependent oxidoreductase [Pseudomonadota bacterium]
MSALETGSRIAVIGAGISGHSAAWLLSQRHGVTLFEREGRLGGHSNTRDIMVGGREVAVDTGFIVFNEATYPNLIALFAHLKVETYPTDMSFAVSLDDGRLEYAGNDLKSLFAQKRNLISPRFWKMLIDLMRFYRDAPALADAAEDLTLDAFLDAHGYGRSVREDHLYPMAAAIWSTPSAEVGAQPAAAFIRFCQNHGLLQVSNRPLWRTVKGGSRAYVEALRKASRATAHINAEVVQVKRDAEGVSVITKDGSEARFDHVVFACHADEALRMLAEPTADEHALLSPFRYAPNIAYLHSDVSQMPKRKAVWSSWNYLARGQGDARELTCSYWMNRLQDLGTDTPVIVTLNPMDKPREDLTQAVISYEHPQFDMATLAAQKALWRLQGVQNTWFCGAHFGAGFHEDGLQSGLAVAEALGGVLRPWQVEAQNGRIVALAGR